MRKTKLLLLTAVSVLLWEVPFETMASPTKNTATETSIFGRKRKGYKPRRGGLFNTGLFRKKNPCGCPKH
ncbi:hypothetical protein WBJ53_32020 [Spirosoma sp. SC4-14]|uniref:hypothetical protein n=1 Tax=Spirosoma sp. SC4-14 TaxID=3128900 RepID=UPI0030CC85D6